MWTPQLVRKNFGFPKAANKHDSPTPAWQVSHEINNSGSWKATLD